MERHDDRNVLFARHAREDGEQVELVAHVKERRRLIEQYHLRLLGDGARQQHALALAVADGVEVALGKLERVDGLHRFVHDALVLTAEHAEPSGVRDTGRWPQRRGRSSARP